ncbi:MAG: hypothetical protein ACFWUE_12080 [Xylanivirga thermophila]|jgi:hypothetical protein
MFKINHSPSFWLILGVLWSITLLLFVINNNFVFNFAYVLIGLLAVSSYAIAIFLVIKHK